MSKNEIPSGGADPQPEKDRLFFPNKALDQTARFVFPMATAMHGLAERMTQRKSHLALALALGGIVEGIRYGEVGRNAWEMLSGSSSADISTLAAMGVLMSPNIVHLASKARIPREPVKAVGRGLVNGAEVVIGNQIVKKALTETAGFLFPATAWISNKGGVKERGGDEAEKSPMATLRNAAKTTVEFVIPVGRIQPVMPMTAIADLTRYLMAGTFIKDATNPDSTRAIVGLALGTAAFLSPNIIYLASKNRMTTEVSKTIGRGITKGAVAALRFVPRG